MAVDYRWIFFAFVLATFGWLHWLSNQKPLLCGCPGPRTRRTRLSLAQEEESRRILLNITESWASIRGNATKESRLDYIHMRARLEEDQDYYDGLEPSKVSEAEMLSELVQSKIRARQNPQNCSTSKILYCTNDQHVGWCAMVHKVLYCLLVAFHSGRSLVLDEQYYKISKYFEPLNPKACPDLYKSLSQSHLPELFNDTESRIVSIVPYKVKNFKQLPDNWPYVLPKDIAKRIMIISPDPEAWFIGQFSRYILRPSDSLQHYLNSKIPSQSEAAIQVRRTNKLFYEADKFEVSEYMEKVEEYYDTVQIKLDHNVERRLFVATDEMQVLKELQTNYPQYKILANETVINAVHPYGDFIRYNKTAFEGIIHDVFRLVNADFVVCTLSSNICRLVYELRMSRPKSVNRLTDFQSLDNGWYVPPFKDTYVKTYKAVNSQVNSDRPGALRYNKGDKIKVHDHVKMPRFGKNMNTSEQGIIHLTDMQELHRPFDLPILDT